jgi:hypothetical protein
MGANSRLRSRPHFTNRYREPDAGRPPAIPGEREQNRKKTALRAGLFFASTSLSLEKQAATRQRYLIISSSSIFLPYQSIGYNYYCFIFTCT